MEDQDNAEALGQWLAGCWVSKYAGIGGMKNATKMEHVFESAVKEGLSADKIRDEILAKRDYTEPYWELLKRVRKGRKADGRGQVHKPTIDLVTPEGRAKYYEEQAKLKREAVPLSEVAKAMREKLNERPSEPPGPLHPGPDRGA